VTHPARFDQGEREAIFPLAHSSSAPEKKHNRQKAILSAMVTVQALDVAYPYIGAVGAIFFLLVAISGKDLFERGLFI
jgi:hypothetical protein